MVSNEVLGYIGTGLAVVFYGSNYVVTKKFPTGDGFSFAWFLSVGILLVGYVTLSLVEPGRSVFIPEGLLGGALWALGNLLVVPIVKLIGLGIGLLVWSGTNLICGYFIGKFGLFGVEAETIHALDRQIMNILGILLAFTSLVIFAFIKPTLVESEDKSKSAAGSQTAAVQYNTLSSEPTDSATFTAPINNESPIAVEKHVAVAVDPDLNSDEQPIIAPVASGRLPELGRRIVAALPLPIQNFIRSEAAKRVLGLVLSVVSGTLYGVNMVPFTLWKQNLPIQPSPMDFVFSHFSGIFLFTSVVFVVYGVAVKRNRPWIDASMMFPAVLSGAMWAVACAGTFYSTAYLGFTQGYCIVSIGPGMVSAAWSVAVFREIRGRRNIVLLLLSFAHTVAAVLLLAFSKQQSS